MHVIGKPEPGYPERDYSCSACGFHGAGWTLGRQSPPAFFLQPHDLYPMTHDEFDDWVSILRESHPSHPKLTELGTTWFPRTPGEVDAARPAVVEMRDQDGARKREPDAEDAMEWLDLMTAPTDSLAFTHKNGGALLVMGSSEGPFRLRYDDERQVAVIERRDVSRSLTIAVIDFYIAGETSACLRLLAQDIDASNRDQ
jgi:hypothetical protein